MPTEEQLIQDHFTDLEMQTLGYVMFVLNMYDNIEEIKKIVQARIDKLSN